MPSCPVDNCPTTKVIADFITEQKQVNKSAHEAWERTSERVIIAATKFEDATDLLKEVRAGHEELSGLVQRHDAEIKARPTVLQTLGLISTIVVIVGVIAGIVLRLAYGG